ncbi:MAG TPA: gliding motility-associated C-terminal domain-containing protein [Bacteroidia bacterium]|nr:gliding motility-associated C-terminal domain-containing protein [Bacteroidia bacterium]
MRNFPLIVFLTILLSSRGIDSLAFNIHCISVDGVGAVTVNWDKNGLQGAFFQKYYVYHSTVSSGPFSLTDSIFIFNNTQSTDPTAAATTNLAYYYVVFKSNNGDPDLYTDTVQAIYLNVTPSGGFANLTWNPIHVPPLATSNPYYKIYREYPAGFYTLIDSVDAYTATNPMTFTDEISICHDTVKYKIELMDSSGCKSVSNTDGDIFEDRTPPDIPSIDSVSVDANGNVLVAWLTGTPADIVFYQVQYRDLNGAFQPLATVTGINSTSFSSTLPATIEFQTLTLITIDSCANQSAQSPVHSTIFLQANFELCARSINLSWSPYSFWNQQPTYEIWVSVNGGTEMLAGTSSTTSFQDTGLISGSNFCYRIRAIDSAGSRSSTSNKVCLVPNFPPPPTFSYIRKVSVTGPNSIKVDAYVDAAAAVTGYELLRSGSAAGPFVSIASLVADGSPYISMSDYNVNTAEQPYYYKISAIDSCGLKVYDSQISKSILLTGVSNSDYTNSLAWDDFSQWPTGVDYYNVYRTVNGFRDPVPLATISNGSVLVLTDTVIDDFYSDGEFCYTVQAVEAQGNPYFFLDSSMSNEICVRQEPVIFIPNAFHPGGNLNETFGPYNGFVDTEDYSFDIFNRWGENIYSTRNPTARWDGSTHQTQAPEGIYIYMIKAKRVDGSEIKKVGAVTLIR